MSPRNYTTPRSRENLCRDSTERGVTEETLFNSPQQVKVVKIKDEAEIDGRKDQGDEERNKEIEQWVGAQYSWH